MAEETTNPVQTAPAEEAPAETAPEAAAAPAAAPAAVLNAPPAKPPDTPRKGSPLLAALTALLIVVGIADAVLWGVVGYYALRGGF